MEVMLEDHALVGSVDLAKRANTNDLHHIHAAGFNRTAIERKIYLIRSTIAIAFSRERESPIRKRYADQKKCRIRILAGKSGDLADKRDGIGCSDQSNLAIQLAYVGRLFTGSRKN